MALHHFRRRLVLGFFISVLPFLAMIFYLFDLWFDTQKRSHLESQRLSAIALSAYVQSVFDKALTGSTLVADDEQVKSLKVEVIEQRLQTLVKNQPVFTRAAVFDVNGNLVATTGQNQAPFTVSDQTYFQELVEARRAVISDAIIGRVTKEVLVLAGSPIENKGKLVGAVVVGIDISTLGKEIGQQLSLPQETTLAILNGNGKLAYATTIPDPSLESREKFGALLSVRRAMAGDTGIIEDEQLPSMEGRYLGVVVPIQGYRWAIAVVERSQSIFADIFSTQRYFLWIGIISIGFFILVTFYTVRRILATLS